MPPDSSPFPSTHEGAGQLEKIWRLPSSAEQLDVLFLGDTSFGENYQERRAENGRANILLKYGYDHGFEKLDALLTEVDLAIANLETPLTRLRTSPFQDIRPWLHYSDPELAPKHLLAHNIKAVLLANNHTHDYGEPGLLDTLSALADHGIVAIGAGRNHADAHAPLRASAVLTDATTNHTAPMDLVIFNAFYGGRQFRDELEAYATPTRAGSAELDLGLMTERVRQSKQQRPEDFVVVVPHWRRDYKWRSARQAQAARTLIESGADLVIGHGSHMLQEIEKIDGRWVINGIGNFIFNSPGRYKSLGVPPYSLIARLTLSANSRLLRLYPIVTNNRRTRYQPTPVQKHEIEEVRQLLLDRTNAPEEFDRDFATDIDQHGWHFSVPLNQQDHTRAPLRSSDVPRSNSRATRHEVASTYDELEPRYSTSPQLIAIALQRRGGSVKWLADDYFVAECDGTHVAYWITASHETGRAGTFAASRKDVARHFLVAAGLGVADGRVFTLDQQTEASAYAATLGDAVVKPIAGRKGRGVTVGVRDAASFDGAWERAASEAGHSILVERRFDGVEARFLSVGGVCVSVTRRIPPHVVGNGRSTVRELIADKNAARSSNPSLLNYPIKMDEYRIERLREKGFELDDVLPDGLEVVLDLKAGVSSGAESVGITGGVHPTFHDVAVRALAAMPGLDIAGVDIIAADFSRPAKPGNYIICEINTGPGIGSHHFPMAGEARDVAGAIADLHLGRHPKRRPSRARSIQRLRNVLVNPPGAGFARPARDPSANLIADEWTKRGVDHVWLTPEFFVAEVNGHLAAYWSTSTHTTGRAAVKATREKGLSRALLKDAGIPIAPGRVFRVPDGRQAAADFASALGTCVVKPVDGRLGKGVSVGLTTRAEFDRAWDLAVDATRRGQVLVEKHVSGDEVSFIIVDGRSVAAGFLATDLTDQVHPSYHAAAAAAAAAFTGLDVARVDIIAYDLRIAADNDNYVVCEVDSRPDLVPFQHPRSGTPRDVARAIVDMHASRAADQGGRVTGRLGSRILRSMRR